MPGTRDLCIYRGSTFSLVLRWEASPWVYRPITAITQSAPMTITCPAHGLVAGWRAAIASVLGMVEANAENSPPKAKDFHQIQVVDVNTVQFNDVNSSQFTAYQSGGVLQYLTPVPLTGYSAAMAIKDKVDGNVLLLLDSTTNNRIVLDPTGLTVTLTVAAADTAAISWANGVYDLELTSPGGVVTTLIQGKVQVEKDITTSP